MDKYPFMQWYTGDWLKDPAVSMCTPSTRGIWFDMLNAMHELGRSGSLRGTADQLARIARCSTTELAQALTEIQITEVAGVHTDRHGVVTVTNRRMARDAEKREKDADRQRKHRGRDGPEADRHGDVTPPSQSGHRDISDVRRHTSDFRRQISSSESDTRASDVRRQRDVDAQVSALGERQLHEAQARFRRAVRIVKPSPEPKQRAKDIDLLAKAAILSVVVFSEDWLVDACEAVRLNKSNKPPCAYLHGVLDSKAKAKGKALNQQLKRVRVPAGFVSDELAT